MVGDYFALGVDEEFGKVPRDFLSLALLRIEKLRIASQVLVNVAALRAVDVGFLEHHEFSTVKLTSEGLDFGISARLLLHELVAGEGQDL